MVRQASRASRLTRLVSAAVIISITQSAPAAPVKSKPTGAKTASDATPDVETAEQLYAKLDYDKANEVAAAVLKQRTLTHDQLVRALRVLAVTYAILDKEEQARDAFLQLLISDPDYSVDTNLGPKVGAPFVEARGHYRSLPTKPGIEVAATVRSDGGQLRITTRDPTHVTKKVSVGYRWTSTGDYTVSQLAVGDGTVEVSAAPSGRTRLDFYAQALDDRDNAVLEAGSPQVPKSAFVEASPRVVGGGGGGKQDTKSGSVFSSPIFWVLAGAAAVGGGTALFFALRPDEPPTSASLSPVIRCGAEVCK